MQIELKPVGTFSVKSSAPTQDSSAVPKLQVKNSLVHRLNFELKCKAIAHALFCNVGIHDL